MQGFSKKIISLMLVVVPCFITAHADGSRDVMPFYRHLVYLSESGQKDKILATVVKYEKLGFLKQKNIESQIILARSYQDMGLYYKSVEIFKGLIVAGELKEPFLSEIYYYQAKNYYHQKKYPEAESAIVKVKNNMAASFREEKDHLHALILLAQGKHQETQDYLRNNWHNTSTSWNIYARFNLAVALIKSGKVDQGMSLLTQAVSREGRDPEMRLLTDKINQVIGYLLIKENKPAQSRQFFEKVRLQGVFSNLSLLGAGWASYMLEQYNQALVPWEELISRDIRDISVQEALLTVPVIYEKLGQYDVSADYLRKAIDRLQGEIEQLDQAVNSIGNHDLAAAISRAAYLNQDNIKVLFEFSSPVALRYISQLNEDRGFSQLLNNYWYLQVLSVQLEKNLAKINALKQSPQKLRTNKNVVDVTVDNLIQRSSALKQKTDQSLQLASRSLDLTARQLLVARKKHLGEYLVQARLSLVQMYDRLENNRQKVQ